MWWIGPMWPKCTFGDQKGLIRNKNMPFGNPPYHETKNCRFLKDIDFFIFLPFMGQKRGVLAQKTVFLSVLDRV
jgi:hypothetical protein